MPLTEEQKTDYRTVVIDFVKTRGLKVDNPFDLLNIVLDQFDNFVDVTFITNRAQTVRGADDQLESDDLKTRLEAKGYTVTKNV